MVPILHVYFGDKKQEFNLTNKTSITLGGSPNSDVVLPAPHRKLSCTITNTDVGVILKSNKPVDLDGQQTKKGIIKLAMPCIISLEPLIAIVLYAKAVDSPRFIDFANVQIAQLGRGEGNDIALKSKAVSQPHARFEKQTNTVVLTDLNSTNGTYVNGTRVKSAKLNDGDVISIAGYNLIYVKGVLRFKNVGNDLVINIETTDASTTKQEYPYFQSSPRLMQEKISGEVEVEAAPQLGGKPQLNILPLIIPAIGMMIPSLITYAYGMLYYSIPMAIAGIIVAVSNYSSQMKKHKNTQKARVEKYEDYLSELSTDLSEKANWQRKMMNETHPSMQSCFEIITNVERRLWERMVDDNDFMHIRIGQGEADFNVPIKIPRKGISLEDDRLFAEPLRMQSHFKTLTNMPICVDMVQNPTVGIVGDRRGVICVVKNMIIQTVTHHSYEDVKIVFLLDPSEQKEWDWARWLPHVWNDEHSMRYMAASKTDANVLLKEFEEIIKQRERELGSDDRRDKRMKLPYILFVIGNRAFVENETFMHYVIKNSSLLGIGVLMLFDDIAYLPSECAAIIKTNRGNGTFSGRGSAQSTTTFNMDNLDDAKLDQLARKLAPVRIKSLSVESKLPSCVTFLQGYGVNRPDEINIEKYWSQGLPYKSMSVPIGVKASGDLFNFDIWQDVHGPFGQVAGMPGSGKTEMIQTWILSMAMHFSPEDVSFVLIDFKGTGLLMPFTDMPHIAGTISDIDKNITRNLIALESELKRRKELFDSYGVTEIKDYLKLYKDGKVQESCQFMMVVVDEFSEMKVQFPDFMPVIDSIFKIGRSLGIYCILMSQKPGGVVSAQVEANTKFRWCLRVANMLESKEMIGHPEAAKITVPGRGYVKVGADDVFELVQSFWSGAPYNPMAKTITASSTKIATVELTGKRRTYADSEKTSKFQSEAKEISVVIRYLEEYVTSKNINRSRPVWKPKLNEFLPIDEVLKQADALNKKFGEYNYDNFAPVVGMVDNPYTQEQYPLALNMLEDGHIAVYGSPGSGKTTFLQTLALSTALTYSPDDVNIYAMDFGSWGLKNLEELPHVGGVALDNEDEKIINLSKMITEILGERRQGFAEHGVNNIRAYSKSIGKAVPFIMLLVDNFSPVLELYPHLDSFFKTLAQSGGGYGIFLVTTATAISGIPYRISQNIKQNIALQMIDKTDYMSIVGRTNGLEPDKASGRGLVRGKVPLEFQTAIHGKAEFSDTVKIIGGKLRREWQGEAVAPIATMPEIVTKSDFVHIPENSTPLGLTMDLSLRFFSCVNQVALVAGTEKSGKTNALKLLADVYLQLKNVDAYWFDLDGKFKAHNGFRVETGDEAMEEILANLVNLAKARKDKKQREPFAVLIIDELPSFVQRNTPQTCENLEWLLANAKSTGIYVYASGNYNELVQLNNTGSVLVKAMANDGISIVTGAKFSQHNYLPSSNLTYTELDQELPEFYGYYTAKGKTDKIKLMCYR